MGKEKQADKQDFLKTDGANPGDMIIDTYFSAGESGLNRRIYKMINSAMTVKEMRFCKKDVFILKNRLASDIMIR